MIVSYLYKKESRFFKKFLPNHVYSFPYQRIIDQLTIIFLFVHEKNFSPFSMIKEMTIKAFLLSIYTKISPVYLVK